MRLGFGMHKNENCGLFGIHMELSLSMLLRPKTLFGLLRRHESSQLMLQLTIAGTQQGLLVSIFGETYQSHSPGGPASRCCRPGMYSGLKVRSRTSPIACIRVNRNCICFRDGGSNYHAPDELQINALFVKVFSIILFQMCRSAYFYLQELIPVSVQAIASEHGASLQNHITLAFDEYAGNSASLDAGACLLKKQREATSNRTYDGKN